MAFKRKAIGGLVGLTPTLIEQAVNPAQIR